MSVLKWVLHDIIVKFPLKFFYFKTQFFSFNNLTLNSPLLLLDGSILPYLEAVDTDVGLFGEISFIIESEDGDDAFFNVIEVNKKQSELVVKQNVEERAYTVKN